MRRLTLMFVLLLVACSAEPRAAGPSPSDDPVTSSQSATAETCPDGSLPAPTRLRDVIPGGSTFIQSDGCPRPQPTPPVPYAAPPGYVQPIPVPMPEVSVKSASFPAGPQPAPRRIALSQLPPYTAEGFGIELMQFLDSARGAVPKRGAMSDDEWNGRVWPGPFQKVVRAAVAAKPAQGRFFHLEGFTIDAAWTVPSVTTLMTNESILRTGLQFIDATLRFRDHAEDPPAEGELWYTWHLRLPTWGGLSAFAIADGYDGVAATTWMNTEPYWTPARLEKEAQSAIAGYLWNESYVTGGQEQFAMVKDTTPFWHSRVAALNGLNALLRDGRLTERRFENVVVRIDAFDPMTAFGGGIVSATVTGRLVETLDGKTVRASFSEPMKFFRFGASQVQLSGWTAVDAFEDGEWVSGGDLALDKLETFHG